MILNNIINFANFFSFLIGLGVGFAIFALVYLLLILLSLNKKKYVIKSQINDVSDEEIKKIILDAQNAFKDKKLKGEDAMIGYCYNLSKELVIHIASRFFPNSKHPVFELSIDELILLANYISLRVDEILSKRGLRIFRKLKISTIVGWTDVKKTIDENPIIKATKKYKISETLTAAKKVINVINPLWWAKRFISTASMNLLLKKLCLVIMGIIGEETYKIYSKSVFDKDVTIDSGVAEIVEEIGDENLMDDDLEFTKDETVKPIALKKQTKKHKLFRRKEQ